MRAILPALLTVFDIRNDPLDPYIYAARWIPLSIHPFMSMTTLISAGIHDNDSPNRYGDAFFQHDG